MRVLRKGNLGLLLKAYLLLKGKSLEYLINYKEENKIAYLFIHIFQICKEDKNSHHNYLLF